jgi:translation initiation factor 6
LPVGKATFSGSPYIGVYLKAGEEVVLAPPTLTPSLERALERVLRVRVVKTTIGDSFIVGALVTLNSRGVVIASEVDEKELALLEELGKVHVLDSRLNALGNTILANDHGAIVHPDFTDREMEAIGEALGVPVARSTIAGEGTVSKTAVATNHGVVVHPGATAKEIAILEATLRAPVHKTTANFGVAVVGACVIANSKGMLVGEPTTPVELVHLEEGLSVYD